MYRFQVSIHARPAEAAQGPTIELRGATIATLDVPRPALASPMAVSFETAVDALRRLPRLFIEPDGSFFWGSPQEDSERWQLDGNLLDRNGRLLFVDLKGSCPPDQLDRLLEGLGWPATPLMFQLTREAIFLDEAVFRRWAEAIWAAPDVSDLQMRTDQ